MRHGRIQFFRWLLIAVVLLLLQLACELRWIKPHVLVSPSTMATVLWQLLSQGVIVADVTVDRSGKVTRSKIVRSPGIARLDNTVLASLKTASPLPAPPPALVKSGAITYSETWLFTNDSKWRLRTLTLPQE